jgi:hypothetical protein
MECRGPSCKPNEIGGLSVKSWPSFAKMTLRQVVHHILLDIVTQARLVALAPSLPNLSKNHGHRVFIILGIQLLRW